MSKNLFKLISMLFERDIISRILFFLYPDPILQMIRLFKIWANAERNRKIYFQSFQSLAKERSIIAFVISLFIIIILYFLIRCYLQRFESKGWQQVEKFISEILQFRHTTHLIYTAIYEIAILVEEVQLLKLRMHLVRSKNWFEVVSEIYSRKGESSCRMRTSMRLFAIGRGILRVFYTKLLYWLSRCIVQGCCSRS